MSNPVVHFEIIGSDLNKSTAFYSELFGWQVNTEMMPGYGLVSPAGEGSIGGGIMGAPEGMRPMVTFYIHVEDIDAMLAKAESLGGKTLMPKMEIPGVGFSGMFADADGNPVGLFTPNH